MSQDSNNSWEHVHTDVPANTHGTRGSHANVTTSGVDIPVPADDPNDFLSTPSKIIHLRALAKPPILKDDGQWQEWKFKMTNYFMMLGIGPQMKEVEEHEVEFDEASSFSFAERAKSRTIYALLVQLTSGRSNSIVRLVDVGCGYKAWWALCRTYEPQLALRWNTMLTSILNPVWHSSNFQEELLQWERLVLDYESGTKAKLPDQVKIAVITSKSLRFVREYVHWMPLKVTKHS